MKKRILCSVLAVLCAVSTTGCGTKKNASDGETTLTWYAYMNKQPTQEAVMKEVNKYTKEKLGVNVDIIPLEDFDKKMQLINASGEEYDLVFTSNWVNNYYKNISDGNLLDLDELIKEYAPKTYASMSENIWDAAKVNGKIYGVPNQQIFARAPVIQLPINNMKKLGYTKENFGNAKLEDYEQYLRDFKAATGQYTQLINTWTAGGYQLYGFEEVLGSNLPGAIKYNDEKPVIVNQYESQEFLDYIKLRRKWNQEGLTSPAEVAMDDAKKYADAGDDYVPFMIAGTSYKPGCEVELKTNYLIDVETTDVGEALLNTYGIVATLTGINVNSKNPEKAMEFIELINTDKDFYNLVCYGVEGVNYEKVADNIIKYKTENSYLTMPWALGNTFNSFVIEGQEADVYQHTDKINKEAKVSPIIGFAPDTDPINTEISNCKAVMGEYINALQQGLVGMDKYDEFMAKLKTAGSDKIIEELQSQLDKWLENK